MRGRNKDSQRKAMFAHMNSNNQRPTTTDYRQPTNRDSSFNQLQKKGIYLKHEGDADKDGVKNVNDCRPLNPNKQGFMHDWQMKRLKKQEEKLETKREAEQKKLEDLKDELKQRASVSSKEASIKQLQNQKKQAVLDEIKAEQNKLDRIKTDEQAANKEMDKYTWTGKTKAVLSKAGSKASAAGSEVKRRWNTPESKKNREAARKGAGKVLKKIWKQIK